jgi:hypothetical protein
LSEAYAQFCPKHTQNLYIYITFYIKFLKRKLGIGQKRGKTPSRTVNEPCPIFGQKWAKVGKSGQKWAKVGKN